MTGTAGRYRRLAAAFTAKVEGVTGDAWDNQSPCEEWTARDVVAHVAEATGMFLGFVGLEAPPGPDAAGDPLGSWIVARDAMQAALDDPAVAGAEFEGMLGRQSLASAADRFLCTDLVVHNWDLSRATGQDEHLDPADVADVVAAMEPLAPTMRRPGVIGPAVDASEGADAQTRMLCFLGRRP